MSIGFNRDDLIALLLDKPHLMGHLAGKTKLTDLHSKWMKHVWGQPSGIHTSLMAHRGSYKTTCLTEIGILWWLLFHPSDRIALLRATWKTSVETLKAIAALAELEPIREVFHIIHGAEPKLLTNKEGRIVFNFKKNVTKEGSVDAYGIDSVPTGSHYDRILCDDIVVLEDRTSRAKREMTKISTMEILSNIIDRGKSVHFVGTPWHPDDAWEMVNNDGQKIVPPPMMCTCYETGLISPAELAEIKSRTSPSLFAANYELRHMASEDSIFKDPTYGEWDHSVPYQWVTAHVDAKFSGDHTCGFTIMSRRKDKKLQAVGFMFTDHIEKVVPIIKQLLIKYRCTKIFVEENPDKGYTGKLLGHSDTNPNEIRPIRVLPYHEKMNKHIKIVSYGPRYWKDTVWHTDNTFRDNNGNSRTSLYMAQILDYREKQEPDDCADSYASLCKQGFFTSDPANSAWKALYTW